tara:strand:- start:1101 stop:3551 length:2451 start_codon:yes stop_codon:yes gene_type:complete
MAIDFTPTISSPGVEIREWDLSNVALPGVGTNVYVTGFTSEGPYDEVIKITSQQDLDQIYGLPTNSAERYFYHTVRETLNSPAHIYTSRLPYGAGQGDGFGSQFSALVYAGSAIPEDHWTNPGAVDNGNTYSTIASGGAVVLGKPTHIELSEAQYLSAVNGTLWEWEDVGGMEVGLVTNTAANHPGQLGKSPLIILNKSTSSINEKKEGYYVSVVDNVDINPASNFVGAGQTFTITTSAYTQNTYQEILPSQLNFPLTASATTGPNGSISEIMENLVDFDLEGRAFDDILNVGVFKLRRTQNSVDSTQLGYNLEDGIVGSINAFRKLDDPRGGSQMSYFLGSRDDNSRNVKIMVNSFITQRNTGDDNLDENGNPKCKVRVNGKPLENVTSDGAVAGTYDQQIEQAGFYYSSLSAALNTTIGTGDDMFPLGAWANSKVTNKDLGDIPTKLDRALDGIKNDEIYDIDVIPEAGLGTIWAMSEARGISTGDPLYYDEFYYQGTVRNAVDGLRTSKAIAGDARTLRNNYNTIFDKFETFVKPPYLGGSRGDAIFIADTFRQIVAIGDGNTRILEDKNKNFQTDIFWPMKHQFESQNTSYAAVYGNWAQIYDAGLGELVWVPFSGFAAATMAKSDAATFPWFAPAGFNRGLLTTATDIAVNPNQKQRDELYKSNINPVAFFPSQGNVIFGQKTLSRKPSAFDRINVRRLFLALERPTKKAAQFFVFEPNTEFTRTRLINVLTPLFERAKQNQGVYDYLIVCDERNNTPQVIDENKLRVDIYLKPVRTAEFILITFYATRTDANFQEIVDGPALLTEGTGVS